ncbi:MAG: hypothetical protein AB1486_25415 [Planctomycetota bacterium]
MAHAEGAGYIPRGKLRSVERTDYNGIVTGRGRRKTDGFGPAALGEGPAHHSTLA